MEELLNWLKTNQLKKYQDILIENDITTLELLSELTEDDIKELGFSLGDRKRFVIGIKELESNSSELSQEDIVLLNSLPYVIAYPLQQTLLEKNAPQRLNYFRDTFLNYLKYLGLLTASEFFNSPFKERKIVDLFLQNLAQPSFGSWNAFTRECLLYLKTQNHTFFCPDLADYYETVETSKKRKIYNGEIEVVDSYNGGETKYIKQSATGIGMIINFRNRYLGHGLSLDSATSEKLWNDYFPIFRTLLEHLTFCEKFPMLKQEANIYYALQGIEIKPLDNKINIDSNVSIYNRATNLSMPIIPFFIIPGELAIESHEKPNIMSYESNNGKTITFFSPEGITKQTSGKLLERLNLLLRDKQKEIPFTPETYTKELFAERIAEENQLTLKSLLNEKKVIEGIYQNREEMEIKLREWIGARANIFFIAAEAGSGKTNLLVEIQKQYAERNLTSLLIRASRMEKSSLKKELCYQLNMDYSLDIAQYTSLAGTQSQPTIIFIDGLNESSNAEAIWLEILEISSAFEPGSLKFIITSRANTKTDLDRYVLTEDQIQYLYGENKDHETSLSGFAFWLTPLDMKEMESAWETYVAKDKNRFKPLFSFNDIATFDRGLYLQINNPLVLRIFLETYKGKNLPKKGTKHLHVWKDWFATFSNEEQKFMSLLTDAIWEQGENELLLDSVLNNKSLQSYFLNDTTNAPYQRLLTLGWISRYVKDLTVYVSFTVEGLLLYLLGTKLNQQNPILTTVAIDQILANGTKLQKSAIESFLCEQALEGKIDLIAQLIDEGDEKLELCVTPLLYFLKSQGVEKTIDKLLENPTENDWVLLKYLRNQIKKNELHSILIQFDTCILSLVDIQNINQEILKINCLETINAEEKLLELEKKINQKSFDKYSISNKYKILALIIEQLAHIDPKSTISLYDEYFKSAKIKLDLDIKCKLYQYVGEAHYCMPGGIEKAEEYIKQGIELIKNKSGWYYEIQKLNLYNSLACCKLQNGYYYESEELFKEIISKARKILGTNNSFFILLFSNYADLNRRLNRFEESDKILKKSLSIAKEIIPENSEIYHNIYHAMGWNNISLYNLENAVDCFKKCLEISYILKGEMSSYVKNDLQNLGIAYLHLNDLENAKINLFKCKDLNEEYGNKDFTNMEAIGMLYMKEENYELSLKYLNEALELNPNNANTLRLIGDYYLFNEEFERALDLYKKTENILLNKEEYRLSLAYLYSAIEQVYSMLKDYTIAIEYCKKQIKQYKDLDFDDSQENLFNTYKRLASYFSELKNSKEAREFYSKCLDISLKNDSTNEIFISKCYFDIGVEWYNDNKYNEALEYFKKSLEIRFLDLENENVECLYFFMGDSYKNTLEFQSAIDFLLKAFLLQRQGGYAFRIAQCFEALYDNENALDYYIQSAEIRKKDIGLENEATQEAILNCKRLAKELNKETELPEWMR